MTGPSEHGIDATGWGVLAVAGGIIWAFAKRIDPRLILVWVNEPVMRPIHDKIDSHGRKLDRVCSVIDRMPGAQEAHAAVKAETLHWE